MPNSINGFRLFKTILCMGILSICANKAHAAAPIDALVSAVAKGDQVAAQAAITAGADVNGLNSDDDFPMTPLTASVIAQSSSMATWLISKGADPSAHDYEALLVALEVKELNTALLLLHKVPSLPVDSGLLVVAANRFPSDAAQRLRGLLLAKLIGQTPDDQAASSLLEALERPDFCIAADDPIISIAKLIISLGVPVDAVSDSSNPPNTTPLQIAIKNGDVFFAQFLLSQGAQLPAGRAINTDLLVSASSVGNTAGLQSLLASHVDPNTADYQGNYALPEALSQGQYAVAKQLIDAGEDPNLSGPKQPSALNTTASRNLKDESALLISKGADINKHDSLGEWPLRSATRSGSLDVMAQLISLHADVNALDPSGNSVLHNLIGVISAPYTVSQVVPVTQGQLGVVSQLQSAGFHFDTRNHSGEGILTTNLVVRDSDGDEAVGDVQYDFLEELAKAGSPIDSDALFFAVEHSDDVLVTWLLNHGGDPNGTRYGITLFEQACSVPNKNPNVALALAHAGATIPTSPQDGITLVLHEVRNNATNVVALLLSKGVQLNTDVDASAQALDLALQNGNAAIVQLLSTAGTDLNAKDILDDTVLHRLVNRDLQSPPGSPPLITPQVEQAVAVLIQNGFNLSLTNHAGLTPLTLASQNVNTKDRLSAAIGMVNSPGSALHQAVRDDDINKVISLLANGSDINAKDNLQRTPITLALQLHKVSISTFLLRHGAAITYLPATDSQSADISYATDSTLAATFAVRLLSRQLLQLRPADLTTPNDAINQFAVNQSAVNPAMSWSFTCVPCNGTAALGDNDTNKLLRVKSLRIERSPLSDYFSLVQFNIQPVPFINPFNGQETPQDFTFTPTGSLTVPACAFDFVTQATCYPGVSISVGPADTFSIVARDGSSIPMPATPVQVTQNGISTTVPPGTKHTFDRSLGPINVQVGPLTSKVFSLAFSTEPTSGSSIDVPVDPLLASRLSTYCRIAALRAQIDDISNSHDDSLAIQAKSLTTAAHLISVGAIQRGYLAAVTVSFASRAQDVLSLNDQMISLRNAIIASSSMTADQIGVLITKINLLLPGLSAQQADAAKQIRNQLQIAQAAAVASNSAVRILQDQFNTYVDTVISEYQELALELAQYIDPSKLGAASHLSPADVAAISAKLSSTDVGVADSVLNGNGALVRLAFGLPRIQ
jgi:ankyrin repeat protein